MIRIIGLIMRPVPKGVAFQGMTLVISKLTSRKDTTEKIGAIIHQIPSVSKDVSAGGLPFI